MMHRSTTPTHHYYDLDFHPTVNPRTLINLPEPWARRRRATVANAMWTTEYQRQYEWKQVIPRRKVDHATETEDAVVAAPAAVTVSRLPVPRRTTAPVVVVVEREESTQTALPAVDSAVQTSSLIAVESAAQTTPVVQPLVTDSTQTERDLVAHGDVAVQTMPAGFKAKLAPAVAPAVPTPVPAAGKPIRSSPGVLFATPTRQLDHSAELEEAERRARHQMLSYGWANQNPRIEDLDLKTFNVTVPAQEVVPFTESRVKRAHEYATALQQHRQRSADKQHAAQERQRVRAKSAAPFGHSSSSSTPFSEYQSVYQDWSPYLTRPAPRYHTGATHYYNSGIQQAQTRMDTVRVEDTAGSRTRKVTTAHSGNVHGPTVAQTTADWTRLQRTVKAAGRPTSSIAVATPYTQAAEEAATQYNPSRYQRAETATAEVKKGSGYHDEGYKSFATTSTSMRSPVATSFTTSAATSPQHEASQQTEPQRVEVMVEPRQTTYDLARALLERAKSRRALHV